MRFPFFWTPQQRPEFAIDAASPPPPPPPSSIDVFEFTARRAVLAIAFHLVDEGIALNICPRSCQVMTEHLTQDHDPNGVLFRIANSHWRRMTHRERLHWLLDRTCTRVDVSVTDGVARLAPA